MAEQVRLIRLTWENGVSFSMETKLNDGSWLTVTSMDENGYFASLWDRAVPPLCKEYFDQEIAKIGQEMKS